jgi:serine/threonine-protein kinase
MIGTLLCGRYRLDERIGSGGMATVYRAFDETLERWVAIKVLHHSMQEDELQLERFRREARTVARMSHPHVVTVIDAGEDDGHPFIVFEFVDGETLKAMIKRQGPLPVTEAVAYAIEIGRALIAAHASRLVHRDVKPQNVLIDGDGRAKVTDFGISRSLDADGLTATGRVLGTTDYVAPEQALGDNVGEQSDLYSLGICLFEMLTGRVPYSADSQVGVAMKHVRDPLPDVQELRPEVSSALAAVIERATAKETRNRYATAAEMVADLERALQVEAARAGGLTNGEATSVLNALPPGTADFTTHRPKRRRHIPIGKIALALVVLLAAGAAAVLVLGEDGTKKKPAQAAAPPPLRTAKIVGATDFDPFGGDGEHPEATRKAWDGNPSTFWYTSTYNGGVFPPGKSGVGIYVWTQTPVAARRVEVLSPTQGYTARIYASNEQPARLAGWGKPIGLIRHGGKAHAGLPGSTAYSHYLVWINKLPPQGHVEISEVRVFY